MMNPMENKKLTLQIDGPRIRAHKFRKAVNAFLDLIDEVAREVTSEKRGVEWIVSVRSGSVMVDFTPESDIAAASLVEGIPDLVSSGLATLESTDERPEKFSDYALEKALELASVIDVRSTDSETLRITANGKSSLLSHKIVANVESLLRTSVTTFGTVEGTLQTLSIRGGIHCVIYDPLTDHAVRCNFHSKDTDLFEEIIQHFKSRIIAYGKIAYKKDGQPKTILVEDFREIPNQEDLPKFKDIYGIFGEGNA